ncbi:MAG TPA: phage holin family protein [Salinimicrobium sp.]|nr:phage holin family protein [Salinimicrobium sp.]
MGFIIRILVTGIMVLLLAEFLPGVAVASYGTALIVALVLALLNLIVKPILVLLTLPITIITLGLFLLVINAIIILLTDAFIEGFDVSGFWVALLFSLLLSLVQAIVSALFERD